MYNGERTECEEKNKRKKRMHRGESLMAYLRWDAAGDCFFVSN